MAFDPWEAALLRPAAITIHDDCDVARNNFYRGRHRLNHDRLGACWTNTDNRQFRAGELRDSTHVDTSESWQLRNFSHRSRRLLPAAHRFIYRFAIDPLGGIAGRDIKSFAIETVANADRNRVHIIESIEIGDGKLIDSIDHPRITRDYGVEPATTPRPSGGRTKFASHFVQHFCYARVLRWQWPLPDSRGVGLHHAEHAVHSMRRNAGAGAGAARGRV